VVIAFATRFAALDRRFGAAAVGFDGGLVCWSASKVETDLTFDGAGDGPGPGWWTRAGPIRVYQGLRPSTA
jgi:hypothetical protein